MNAPVFVVEVTVTPGWNGSPFTVSLGLDLADALAVFNGDNRPISSVLDKVNPSTIIWIEHVEFSSEDILSLHSEMRTQK